MMPALDTPLPRTVSAREALSPSPVARPASGRSASPSRLTHERVGRILAGASLLVSLLLAHAVNPWFLLLAAGTALNLALSGVTDRCVVKNLLVRMGLPGERDVGREEALRGAETGDPAPMPWATRGQRPAGN